jgi:hypothetical protein
MVMLGFLSVKVVAHYSVDAVLAARSESRPRPAVSLSKGKYVKRLKAVSSLAVAGVTLAAVASAAQPAAAAATGNAAARSTGSAAASSQASAKPTVAYSHLDLPNGDWARVYSDGLAEVYRDHGQQEEIQHVALTSPDDTNIVPGGDGTLDLPSKGDLMTDLLHAQTAPYAASQVVVVYKSSVTPTTTVSAAAKSLAAKVPSYTNTASVNKVLDKLGVDQSHMLFTSAAQRSKLEGLRSAAEKQTGKSLLNFSAATVLHVTGSSVPKAVSTLMANPDVEYAEPNWSVTTDDVNPVVPPASALKAPSAATGTAAPADTTTSLPGNYALTASAQSLLNAPGVNAVPAFADLAKKYGQLPGQGEIITNVSLGDLDDASAASNPSDSCSAYVKAYGPTTIVQNGQRYIDWPSMPLIPAYTASSTGTLDPTGETCGSDPQLAEVGLDFSMMAPLPHDQQRAGETGTGYADLLGIAPGASYRLVVPSSPSGAVSDVDAALVAAADQTPRPDVITSSIGFGTDQYGFSSRYLEDDPLSESIITSIVNSGIVVTVSAGDGLRTYTNATVAPSGGAVATNVTASPADVTNVNDLYLSSAPSADLDSGAIDVGGSTLDDVSIAPPDNPADAAQSWIQAYPATRYDAARNYATGYGTRVNVSAPGDDVLSFSHPTGGDAESVNVDLEGGTSAAAPETAAAAAIVLQVARLTRDTSLEGNPRAVRGFLEQTGTPLGGMPQSDTPLNAGPQVNVGRAVETLLARAHQNVAPGVARVAIAQRQETSVLDQSFTTATDPSDISLTGQLSQAPITIAPDWTGLPATPAVTYRLTGPGKRTLAITPWARLTPQQVLASARLPLQSSTSRTVTLTYTASESGRTLATTTFTLTFGPWEGTTPTAPAPVAPSVVTGPVIPVSYNLTGLADDKDPTLVVSSPGRVDPASGLYFDPSYTAPLTATKGTVDVPVSKLQGGGIYGIGIQDGPGGASATDLSPFTVIRVSPTGSAKPGVPALSQGTTTGAHLLTVPYNGSFQVTYDVASVPGATGAVAEVSAAGPSSFGSYATFNNPNGSERDDNGHDSGSVAWIPLKGTHGTATLTAAQAGLAPTAEQQIRIFATRPGGRVTGEASGVSTLTENGIATADGGILVGGFGVSQTGNDGVLTSQGSTSSGLFSSLETFSQTTGATTTVHSAGSAVYVTNLGSCPAMTAGDRAVYQNEFGNLAELDTLSSVANGTDGPSVTLPTSQSQAVLCVAGNQDTNADAILGTYPDLTVMPANLAAGTIGTPVDIQSYVASYPSGAIVGGFTEDSATNTATVAVSPYNEPNDPGLLITVNLNTGQVTTAPGAGTVSGIAVDQSNGDILQATGSGVSIYDPSTGQQTPVNLGGLTYEFPVSIPGTDDFLVADAYSPDALASTPNNNALGSVIEVDDKGNVVHQYEEFNYFGSFFSTMGSYLQVNPTTKTAFTVGGGDTALQSFSYAG